jgi:hypothetical protein
VVNGTLLPLSNFVGSINTYSYYGTYYSAQDPQDEIAAVTMTSGGTYLFSVRETYVQQAGAAAVAPYNGVSSLNARLGMTFTGDFIVRLPKKAYGARVDYSNWYIGCVAVPQGTIGQAYVASTGAFTPMWTAVTVPLNPASVYDFAVSNPNQQPAMADVILLGAQPYVV